MIYRIYFLISLSLLSIGLQAQANRDSISVWSLTLIQDTVASNRETALEKLESTLDRELIDQNNLELTTGEVEGVSKVSSKDGRVEVITFIIFRNENQYDFLGYLIDHSKNKAIKLTDQSVNKIAGDEKYAIRTPENWWGAIYYDIHKIDENTYLLFGYDSYSLYEHMKILDVLDLSGGDIKFGKPVFGVEGQSFRMRSSRFFYTYSALTSATLRYDGQLEMIVMDHLEEINSPYEDIPMMTVPDGTMSGYNIHDGVCDYIDRIDIAIDQSVPTSSSSDIKRKEIYKRPKKKQ